MTRAEQPFFVRGIRVGTVGQIESHAGFKCGKLQLEDCPERPIFETVVSLAREVDTAASNEYQARWEIWNRLCGELPDLRLWIGDGKTQIEEFTIESDWSIEWRNMNEVWDD